MRPASRLASLAVFAGMATFAAMFAACSRDAPRAVARADAPRQTGDPVATASLPAAPKGTLALGERITSGIVPLGSIANDAKRYEDQVVATTGTVTAVCQEMGCWMELRDESARARVRMHGHTFFVPKTASGHVARVQAKVIRRNSGPDDCEPGAASGAGKSAQIELDATGVELD